MSPGHVALERRIVTSSGRAGETIAGIVRAGALRTPTAVAIAAPRRTPLRLCGTRATTRRRGARPGPSWDRPPRPRRAGGPAGARDDRGLPRHGRGRLRDAAEPGRAGP